MSEDMEMVNRMLSAFLTYVLVMIRVSPLFMFAPFFSSEVFFQKIRLIFAATLPILLVPVAVNTAVVPPYLELQDLFLLAGQELALGLAIAFLSSMVFVGVQMAGEISGQQIGFSMANVLDPQSGIEMPMLGFINMNLTLMMFVTANLHLILIYIMAKSYEWIGIGALIPDVNYNHPALMMGTLQVTEMLRLGARMAVPVMMIMLMNSIVEGFVTKTMPQMNIQVFGIPLRVVLGLSVLVFAYPALCMALIPDDWKFNLEMMPEGPIGDMLVELSGMVQTMGGGGRAAVQ